MTTRLLILLVVLAVCSPAWADVFTLNSSQGVWSSAAPAGAASGVGTSQIRWGVSGGSGQSGYDYTGATPPSQNLATETQFLVGAFVHHNEPVTGIWLTGAALDITMNMTFNGTSVIDTFRYNFGHTETPNTAPCPFPSPNLIPCDDRVQILNSIPDATFTIGGVLYTLSLLGFSQDGGATVSETYFTAEDTDNVAQLYGEITSNFTPNTPVPEPISILLLATSIGIIAAKRLRRA